jgi:hypothetical protein
MVTLGFTRMASVRGRFAFEDEGWALTTALGIQAASFVVRLLGESTSRMSVPLLETGPKEFLSTLRICTDCSLFPTHRGLIGDGMT